MGQLTFSKSLTDRFSFGLSTKNNSGEYLQL